MIDRIPEKKKGIDLMTVLAYLIVARFSCSALSNIPVFTMTFTFLYGLAFVCLFFVTTRRITKRELTLLGVALLYTAYMVWLSLANKEGLFSTDPFNAYAIVFFVCIYLWSKHQPPVVRRNLLIVFFLGLMFSYVYSIAILLQDPAASRVVASAERSPLDTLNAVCGFEEVHGAVFLVCILYMGYKSVKHKKKFSRICLVCVLVVAVVFILMASYATAILLLLMAAALLLASKNKLISILLAALVIAAFIFHEEIGRWIMTASGTMDVSDVLKERVFSFGEMLKTFEASGTYAGEEGRAARIDRSWETFLKYPVFGGLMRSDGRSGGHSELFDILAKYGMVGLLFVVILFGVLYNNVHKSLKTAEFRNCHNIILVIYVVMAVLNPALFPGQTMPLILVLPLMSSYTDDLMAVETAQKKESGT